MNKADLAAMVRDVHEGVAIYARAIREANADLLLAIADEDIQVIDPRTGVVAGHDGLREMLEMQRQSFEVEAVSFDPEAVIQAGDTAQASGTWTLRVRPRGGRATDVTESSGQFVEIWRRAGRRWLLQQHVTLPAAPDAPLPSAAAGPIPPEDGKPLNVAMTR